LKGDVKRLLDVSTLWQQVGACGVPAAGASAWVGLVASRLYGRQELVAATCSPAHQRLPCLLQAQGKLLESHSKQLDALAAGTTPYQQVSGCACLPRGSGWRERRGCMVLA